MRQPEIRCVEFVESVTDWMERALDDEHLTAIEEHLAVCPHCTDYIEQLRLAIELLGSMPGSIPEVPPPAARAALLEAFRARRT
jgi:predicted anti-sigma-YlaC factor YlaD